MKKHIFIVITQITKIDSTAKSTSTVCSRSTSNILNGKYTYTK